MREALLERLRCPLCAAERALTLEDARSDEREVRDGTLRCASCGEEFRVCDGIVELLPDPPEYIKREASGLARFAGVMRADGWDRERIRQLPYDELPYWWGQRRAMEYWLTQLPLTNGQWLLDLGANTCWASAMFAERGLSVIALDIATVELQGLRTADYFIGGDLFFERLLSTMAAPAVASDAMDYVFCCESLHHNSPGELRRTLRECYRVLRPGGSLLLVNEPLRFPLRLKRDHGQEVAEFEGNEHVYFLHQYVRAARAAGFRVSVRWPRNVARRSRNEELPPPAPPPAFARAQVRRMRAAWKLAVTGEASLNMLCRKPS
jgi:SAM-dependent methyltransferase